jgi:hypothetical protein
MFVKVENILNLYPMVHSGTFHVYGFAPFSRGEKRLFSRVSGRFVTDPMSHSKAYRCRVLLVSEPLLQQLAAARSSRVNTTPTISRIRLSFLKIYA